MRSSATPGAQLRPSKGFDERLLKHRLAYLSDDYHFTRKDVPAIAFSTGLHEDYHQPTDEASRIRYDELGRILEVMSDLARYYADGAPRPAYRRPDWFLTPE